MTINVLTVVGARPQFIKAAAVSRAVGRHNQASPADLQIDEMLVHTGQHYDSNMSDVFFEELGIPAPAHQLDVGSGGHGEQTGEMMKRLEPIVAELRPDVLLVYGDTNSTTAGALVAAKLHIPVAHVEAGLRSFDRRMPEEVNRVVTDHLSTWLFAPTPTAVAHLASEGITDGVHHVGDVMLDVFSSTLEQAVASEHGTDAVEGVFVLVTVHRPSNTDDALRLAQVVGAVNRVAEQRPVIWPVHPRLRERLSKLELSPKVRVIDPVGYAEMALLLHHAAAVVTDSGGLQKEAYWASTPCITLRNETEWTETVEDGWNVLLGADLAGVPAGVDAMIDRLTATTAPVGRFGTGRAGDEIISVLTAEIGMR